MSDSEEHRLLRLLASGAIGPEQLADRVPAAVLVAALRKHALHQECKDYGCPACGGVVLAGVQGVVGCVRCSVRLAFRECCPAAKLIEENMIRIPQGPQCVRCQVTARRRREAYVRSGDVASRSLLVGALVDSLRMLGSFSVTVEHAVDQLVAFERRLPEEHSRALSAVRASGQGKAGAEAVHQLRCMSLLPWESK